MLKPDFIVIALPHFLRIEPILECCKNFNIEHLIYASSSSVYGGNTKLTTTSSGVDFDSGTSTLVNIKGDSGGTAGLRLGGDSSQDQCTGFVEVHQDETHGGGMFYNGDASPSFATGETADYFSIHRLSSGVRHSVMRWFHSSNDTHVQGNMLVDNGTSSTVYVRADNGGQAGVMCGGDNASSQTQSTGFLRLIKMIIMVVDFHIMVTEHQHL